jgi:hypothetical protein
MKGKKYTQTQQVIDTLRQQGKTDMQLSTFMLIANALGLRFSLVVG